MRIYNHPQYSYVKIVEISKDEISKVDMALCAQPKQTLSQYYNSCEVKPSIICNGGFFNMADGMSCFSFTDNGTIISSNPDTKEGFGVCNGELKYGNIDVVRFNDFISAYPMLIKDGQPVSSKLGAEINYKARRTILAYDDKNIYIIAIEKPGMNFAQMKNLLKGMKVDYAMNLDGGGSTKILQDGKSITSTLYNRPVDNVVAFYLKPKTIYRIQLGAFTSKPNADSYLAKIKKIPDTINAGYKNAYVRKIGKYYKVQVGAFSVKANATKVVNDLKSKGYSAFITV